MAQRAFSLADCSDGGSSNWEGPDTDGRQFDRQHKQMISPSRTKEMSTAHQVAMAQ